MKSRSFKFLLQIGEYDSDEGELWDEEDDEEDDSDQVKSLDHFN